MKGIGIGRLGLRNLIDRWFCRVGFVRELGSMI